MGLNTEESFNIQGTPDISKLLIYIFITLYNQPKCRNINLRAVKEGKICGIYIFIYEFVTLCTCWLAYDSSASVNWSIMVGK